MNDLRQKLKVIFLPFVVLSISIISGYTFLHWFLFIRWHRYPVQEFVVNTIIPLLLPWIPLYIWLLPKIQLLELDYRVKKPGSNLLFVAGLTIAIPTALLQPYIETATGKLTRLEAINEITQKPFSKYYTLKNCFIDKEHAGRKSYAGFEGRGSQLLSLNIYLSLPILSKPNDTFSRSNTAWYGIHYSRVRERYPGDDPQKELAYFERECMWNLETKDLSRFIYLERLGNTDDHNNHLLAARNSPGFYNPQSDIVLVPVNKPFDKRNGNNLIWAMIAWITGSALWLLIIDFLRFDEAYGNTFK